MEEEKIIRILNDFKELSKSTRFYNLSTKEQTKVIISQRPELIKTNQ